jgi:hypothetical protein
MGRLRSLNVQQCTGECRAEARDVHHKRQLNAVLTAGTVVVHRQGRPLVTVVLHVQLKPMVRWRGGDMVRGGSTSCIRRHDVPQHPHPTKRTLSVAYTRLPLVAWAGYMPTPIRAAMPEYRVWSKWKGSSSTAADPGAMNLQTQQTQCMPCYLKLTAGAGDRGKTLAHVHVTYTMLVSPAPWGWITTPWLANISACSLTSGGCDRDRL